MNSRVLIFALFVLVGMAVAQSGQSAAATPSDPSKVPVTYNPQVAPPTPAYTPATQSTTTAPAVPGAIELPAAVSTVNSPSMPSYVEAPTAPPTVSQPGLPANNYGPPTPSGDNRLTTPPMIGNGAPTPMSTTLPPATVTSNAPQPPTCDKTCY
jgi:hypothetical protein